MKRFLFNLAIILFISCLLITLPASVLISALSQPLEQSSMLQGKVLRVARPTDNLDEVVQFYTKGVGLEVLYNFKDHQGFDGVMLGFPGASYHLELTHHRGHWVGRAPTQDNLLVFYLPNREEWQHAVDQMKDAGYQPVKSYNPYWDKNGLTFEDPDGYRVVLQNDAWES